MVIEGGMQTITEKNIHLMIFKTMATEEGMKVTTEIMNQMTDISIIVMVVGMKTILGGKKEVNIDLGHL